MFFGLLYIYILCLRSCPNIVGLLYPLFEVSFGYAGLVVRRLNLSARPVTVTTCLVFILIFS